MALLTLPIEVLLLIGNAAIADRETEEVFENLYLSCKTIQQIYKPLLPRYNLISKYRDFRYRRGVKSIKGWPIRTPWQLLYEIHLQPEIVDIIEIVDLRYTYVIQDMQDAGFPAIDDPNGGQKTFDTEKVISDMLKHSPHLSRAGFSWRHWLDMMLEEEQERQTDPDWPCLPYCSYGNAFLLSLLSNVDTIVVDEGTAAAMLPEDHKTYDLLKYLCEHANHETAPLSKLREILPTYGSSYISIHSSLCNYQYFLTLPTLEAATLGLCCAIDGIGFSYSDPQLQVDYFPMLKELNLLKCEIDAPDTYALLSRTPSLQVLKLNVAVGLTDSRDRSFDPRGVMYSIARAVGHGLKSFSLTAASDSIEYESMITSFREMKNLEQLEFTCDMVEEASFHLVDTIPNTVKELRIKGDLAFKSATSANFIKRLFKGFNAGFPAALPNLETTEIICPVFWSFRKPNEDEKIFKDLLKPFETVQALKQDGFMLKRYAKPWPKWFTPD